VTTARMKCDALFEGRHDGKTSQGAWLIPAPRAAAGEARREAPLARDGVRVLVDNTNGTYAVGTIYDVTLLP